MDVRVPLRVATVGSRALAQLIDLVLLHVVQLMVFCLGMIPVALLGTTGTDGGLVVAGMVLGVALLSGGWFIGYELAWRGQTPGKRWVGLRVVTEDGRVPDAGAIVLRNAMRLVDFLPGGYLVGTLAMIRSTRGQRLGDIVAGTLVVAEDRAPARARRWPPGMNDADIRLAEAWFARATALTPEVQEQLARQLLRRIGQEVPADATAVATLEALCPVHE